MHLDEMLAALPLVCPDDSSGLAYRGGKLTCLQCGRHFSILDDRVIELLPTRPAELPGVSADYQAGYLEDLKRPFFIKENEIGWASAESVPLNWKIKKERQVNKVIGLFSREKHEVFCDLSAGAGYYTFAAVKAFPCVLHCDLSFSSLNYSYQKAKTLGLENIFFLRIDYFNPPFDDSLPNLICMDTLIRGEAHEKKLLIAIMRSIRKGGKAVVDFHNWWHNPFRRLGMLRNNFTGNTSYSRGETTRLLRRANISYYTYVPFHQELDPGIKVHRLLSKIIPATRLMYCLSK